jgi:hypothetical protein
VPELRPATRPIHNDGGPFKDRAPVNLAPDGDPKYQAPHTWRRECEDAKAEISALQETVRAMEVDGQFLLDRLKSFSDGNLTADGCVEWNGHILPAYTRLKNLLVAHRAKAEKEGA